MNTQSAFVNLGPHILTGLTLLGMMYALYYGMRTLIRFLYRISPEARFDEWVNRLQDRIDEATPGAPNCPVCRYGAMRPCVTSIPRLGYVAAAAHGYKCTCCGYYRHAHQCSTCSIIKPDNDTCKFCAN
jgi:recombinational DNA repair protein RecR